MKILIFFAFGFANAGYINTENGHRKNSIRYGDDSEEIITIIEESDSNKDYQKDRTPVRLRPDGEDQQTVINTHTEPRFSSRPVQTQPNYSQPTSNYHFEQRFSQQESGNLRQPQQELKENLPIFPEPKGPSERLPPRISQSQLDNPSEFLQSQITFPEQLSRQENNQLKSEYTPINGYSYSENHSYPKNQLPNNVVHQSNQPPPEYQVQQDNPSSQSANYPQERIQTIRVIHEISPTVAEILKIIRQAGVAAQQSNNNMKTLKFYKESEQREPERLEKTIRIIRESVPIQKEEPNKKFKTVRIIHSSKTK